MDKLSILRKKYEEKIATEHMDAAIFISMWFASSAELSADTCRKKLQCVALDLDANFPSLQNLFFFNFIYLFFVLFVKKIQRFWP